MSTGQILLKAGWDWDVRADECRRRLLPLGLDTSQCERPQRLQEQRNIEKQGTVQNVLEIVAGLVFRRILVAQPVDLSETGNAWFHIKSLPLPITVMANFLGPFRPGSDKAHVPTQYVQQLRQ